MPPLPRSLRRIASLGVLAGTVGAAAGCGAVTVPAPPSAGVPACASIVQNAPRELLGLPLRETTSQGTLAWGSGADTVVLRCGVPAPGPTTDPCTRLGDADGVTVDWLVRESDGIVTFTTYGRSPAVDLTVPRSVAPDQPSAAALELAGLVAPLKVSTECIGPGDAG